MAEAIGMRLVIMAGAEDVEEDNDNLDEPDPANALLNARNIGEDNSVYRRFCD